MKCIFNKAVMNAIEVQVTGVACNPDISFHGSGTLFFKPTCVGASSERTIKVKNNSKVPVGFQWTIPEKLRNVFKVLPPYGKLEGKDTFSCTLKFTPHSRRFFDGR